MLIGWKILGNGHADGIQAVLIDLLNIDGIDPCSRVGGILIDGIEGGGRNRLGRGNARGVFGHFAIAKHLGFGEVLCGLGVLKTQAAQLAEDGHGSGKDGQGQDYFEDGKGVFLGRGMRDEG